MAPLTDMQDSEAGQSVNGHNSKLLANNNSLLSATSVRRARPRCPRGPEPGGLTVYDGSLTGK